MVGVQMGHQDGVDVLRFDAHRRQVAGEPAESRSHHGTAATIDQHQTIGQMDQEGVHHQPWRHRTKRRSMQRLRFTLGNVGDDIEEVECLVAEHPVVQRGHDDFADGEVMHAGRLLCGLCWA